MKTIECWYVCPWVADLESEFSERGMWCPDRARVAIFSSLEEAMKYAKSLTDLVITGISELSSIPIGTDYSVVEFWEFSVYDSFQEFSDRGDAV